MNGALAKTYGAQRMQYAPKDIYTVSIMPCIAKKYEGLRPELNSSGQQDIDATLTTRELAYLIRKAGIDFASLPDGERDSLMGESTGGATIFGVTGGVMEAALRFAYQAVTGIRPDSWVVRVASMSCCPLELSSGRNPSYFFAIHGMMDTV